MNRTFVAGVRFWLMRATLGIWILLFIATTGLWIRSRWYTDEVAHYSVDTGGEMGRKDEFFINSWEGRIFIFSLQSREGTSAATVDPEIYSGRWRYDAWRGEGRSPPPSATLLGRLGFYRTGFKNAATELSMTAFPHWIVAIPLAVPIPIIAWRWRRRGIMQKRIAQGQCIACGYDLRASSDRCPECGSAITETTP